MSKLTGIKDLDFLILNKSFDKDLLNIGRANRYFNTLFENEILWKNRLTCAFPLTVDEVCKLMIKLEFDSFKEFYKWLKRKYVGGITDVRYKFANKHFFCSDLNYLKSNINLDIDFSVIFDSKQTILPNFIDRKLFVKEIKRYIYSSGVRIDYGYAQFYDEVIYDVLAGAGTLENLYTNIRMAMDAQDALN